MFRLKTFLLASLAIAILLPTALTNAAPRLAFALPDERTHDQAHDLGFIDWSGLVQYAYLTHKDGTSLPPEEIHGIGLREVARIRAEMEKVKDQVGFEGDGRGVGGGGLKPQTLGRESGLRSGGGRSLRCHRCRPLGARARCPREPRWSGGRGSVRVHP